MPAVRPKRIRLRRGRRKSKLLVVYEDALKRACELGDEESLDKLARAMRHAIAGGVLKDMFALMDTAGEGKTAERYANIGSGIPVAVASPRFRAWRLVSDIAEREIYRSWSHGERPSHDDEPRLGRRHEGHRPVAVAVSRPRERRSPRSTRQAASASSSSGSESGLGDSDPPGALWRALEVLAAEVRWRLFLGRGASC